MFLTSFNADELFRRCVALPTVKPSAENQAMRSSSKGRGLCKHMVELVCSLAEGGYKHIFTHASSRGVCVRETAMWLLEHVYRIPNKMSARPAR